MITIVDYDAGNAGSVVNICRKAGGEAQVSRDPDAISTAGKLILPGVGHFGRAMERLTSSGIAAALEEAVVRRKAPILGICLGMQLLTTHSEEGDAQGLGFIAGRTTRFRPGPDSDLKVPHMGWNAVEIARADVAHRASARGAALLLRAFLFRHLRARGRCTDAHHARGEVRLGAPPRQHPGHAVPSREEPQVRPRPYPQFRGAHFAMLRARVIPCLLLKGSGLVKTVRFADPKYVGDPINAVKLFNDLEVDELVILDITATREGREPAYERVG